jgi:alpha-D-ribose 1-methylphosphonate 5-triphosphate synthase subunit PhnH
MIAKEKNIITQKTFRVLLQAMSHPGRVYNLSQESGVKSQESESDGLLLILQALLDHEVGFCVIGKEKEYLESNISELTGCPVKDISDADFIIVSDYETYMSNIDTKGNENVIPAKLVPAGLKQGAGIQRIRELDSRLHGNDGLEAFSGESNGEILKAKRGTLEYPDTGATVIYSICSLSQIPPYPPLVKGGIRGDLRLTLKGPGINGEISPFLSGVSKREFLYLKEINSEYPLGIDSVFIDSANRIMCIPRSTTIEVK